MRIINVRLLLSAFFFPFFLVFFPIITLASSLHSSMNNRSHQAWFVGLGGGASWTGLASSTAVMNGLPGPGPFNQDLFTINSGAMPLAQFEVGYAAQHASLFLPAWSAYLQYRHYFAANISGNIDQYSIPAFGNYNYTMSYEADQFTINGKLNLFRINQLLPYLSGGVGFILNHINDYRESAKPGVTPRVSPAYQGNSQTKLALVLGAGLDFLINDVTTVTLGYDHVFQGDLKSGPGEGTWSNTTLNLGNIKMDNVFINVAVNFS